MSLENKEIINQKIKPPNYHSYRLVLYIALAKLQGNAVNLDVLLVQTE